MSNGTVTFARKASVQRTTLRMALGGLSKSGKTFDALVMARSLIETLFEFGTLRGNGRICVIDSENARSEQYADMFDFDVYDLAIFSAEAYIDALNGAVKAGYSVVIVDSISHEWAGSGGILEHVGKVQAASKSGNSFTAWAEGTPKHNAFIDSLVRCPVHLICTMRLKQEYELERNEKGQLEPKKLGLAPVQRDSTDYEFDVVGTIDSGHRVKFEARGTLSRLLGDRVFMPGKNCDQPGDIPEVGKLIGKWVSGRTSAEELMIISREQIDELQGYGNQLGWNYGAWKQLFDHLKISGLSMMSPEMYEKRRAGFIKEIAADEAKRKVSADKKQTTAQKV